MISRSSPSPPREEKVGERRPFTCFRNQVHGVELDFNLVGGRHDACQVRNSNGLP